MKTKMLVLLLVMLSGVVSSEENFLILKDDDFQSRLADIDTTLVMFSAEWCAPCNDLKKELKKASESLNELNSGIAIAIVDCEKGGERTCEKHSVVEYPEFKIFIKDQIGQDYYGNNNADDILKFLNSRYGLSSRELLTLSDIEKFLKVPQPAVIGLFEKDSELETTFTSFADHFKEDWRFGHSTADEVLSKYNERNGILCFRAPQYRNKFEPDFVTFGGKTSEELYVFLQENLYGLVGHRTKDNLKHFQEQHIVAYYTIDYTNNVKATNYWRNRILQVAKEYSADFKFAISEKEEFRNELLTYGYDNIHGEKPLVATTDKDKKKFKMTAEFSVENFKQFLTDLKEGKVEPFIKSLPIPSNNDGLVKVAVARNFDELVYNNDKDTFIEFSAPWCAYCKDMEPVLEELAQEMLDEDVVIVKYDATGNEVPHEFEITGYPTFFRLPKNSKFPGRVVYNGKFELKNFIKHIAEHATTELKKYDRSGNPKKTEL